jgi:hypothetical protein
VLSPHYNEPTLSERAILVIHLGCKTQIEIGFSPNLQTIVAAVNCLQYVFDAAICIQGIWITV